MCIFIADSQPECVKSVSLFKKPDNEQSYSFTGNKTSAESCNNQLRLHVFKHITKYYSYSPVFKYYLNIQIAKGAGI